MRRLWCQLAVSYTLLAFCAMVLLMVTIYGINDYADFHSAITPENIEKLIADEKLSITQAIRDVGSTRWREKARETIREKLINIEHGSGADIYRITNSSRPEIYLRISDTFEHPLIVDPVHFPDEIAAQFASQRNVSSTHAVARWLSDSGPIWVDMPITSDSGELIGRVQIFYIATFDLWVQLRSIFDFLLMAGDMILLCSVPIGIACGLVASRYVTRQLQKMNEVTESWRRGHFEARIALPNDDVLIRHSQHLNDMAQDLEMYLRLKQNIAVSDERTRLARELHDTVKQKLFALGLQLATAKNKPAVMEAAGEHITEAEAITCEAQHDLMEIITQLRPAEAGNASLFERLGVLVEDFKRRFDVGIELRHADAVQRNADNDHHVLRIVQESLTNAVRHGKASDIVIAVEVERGIATLMISDNGSGFDTGARTEGFGITSMRERVRDLPQGTFDIRSATGCGTQITLSWRNEL